MLKTTPRWAPGLLLAGLLAACGTPEPAAAPTSAPAAAPTSAPAAELATLEPVATQEASPEPAASPGAAGVPATPIPPARRATFTPALPAPATRGPEPPPVAPKPPAGQWQAYQSQAGRFTAGYPAGWSVAEQPGADGESSVTFAAPDGAAQIVVQTRPAQIEPGQPHDLPNTRRCKTVLVGEAAATRCGDTVTLMRVPPDGSAPSVVTISATPGVAADIFESFLQQFALAP